MGPKRIRAAAERRGKIWISLRSPCAAQRSLALLARNEGYWKKDAVAGLRHAAGGARARMGDRSLGRVRSFVSNARSGAATGAPQAGALSSGACTVAPSAGTAHRMQQPWRVRSGTGVGPSGSPPRAPDPEHRACAARLSIASAESAKGGVRLDSAACSRSARPASAAMQAVRAGGRTRVTTLDRFEACARRAAISSPPVSAYRARRGRPARPPSSRRHAGRCCGG